MRRFSTIAALLVGALALAAPAFADNAGLTPVQPESPSAEGIRVIYWILVVVTGIIGLLVEGALLVFVLRYRRGRRPVAAEGPQVHGNTRLEVLWTVVPVLIVVFLVGMVLLKLPEIANVPEARAGGGENFKVQIEGRRYYWQYTYPDGSITYDTLVVPVSRPVELAISAPAWDVVHSWWVPALNGKMDAIPGITNQWWFEAKREGEYEGNCTEFCGLQHSAMVTKVRAVPEARLDAELRRLAGNGKEQFDAACAKCHNVEGPRLVGPTLKGSPTLQNRESLRTLLENGRGKMPPVGRDWTDEQFDTLFRYVSRIAGTGGG